MSRFAHILKDINERLVLPQPLKYRIMKEIAADLEDTFNVYVSKGLSATDAESKALAKIAADDTVIDQLMEIHETTARKILRKFSDNMRRRVEMSLWAALLVVVGVSVAALLLRSENLASSPFNWLTGGFILCMTGISAWKFYELYIKRDHNPQFIHRGLTLLIYICGLTMLLTTLGFFVGIQESISMIRGGFEMTEQSVEMFIRSITMISFGSLAAVFGAIVWLILSLKTMDIEDRENVFLFSKPIHNKGKLP
ncbi:hypothetical protein ACFL6P_06295 [Candidatus Latescibacterota bacterium]